MYESDSYSRLCFRAESAERNAALCQAVQHTKRTHKAASCEGRREETTKATAWLQMSAWCKSYQTIHMQPNIYNYANSICRSYTDKHIHLHTDRTMSVSILDYIQPFIWIARCGLNVIYYIFTPHQRIHFAPWAVVPLWKEQRCSTFQRASIRHWTLLRFTPHCCSTSTEELQQRERHHMLCQQADRTTRLLFCNKHWTFLFHITTLKRQLNFLALVLFGWMNVLRLGEWTLCSVSSESSHLQPVLWPVILNFKML